MVFEGSHIVEAIGQLHQDDPDILHHGQNHFSEILCLVFFRGSKSNLADFGHPIDQLDDFIPKVLPDLLEGGECVLHTIVEKSGCHGGNIEFELSQDSGDLQRMNEVRLSGKADLS